MSCEKYSWGLELARISHLHIVSTSFQSESRVKMPCVTCSLGNAREVYDINWLEIDANLLLKIF